MQSLKNNSSEYVFKILVVGEASTGKTSFIKRYVHQFFSRAYKATIGVDFALKTIQYDENTLVRLQLWDIAGQEQLCSMTRVYYKDAVGAFLVFDANQRKAFEPVIRWKDDLDKKRSEKDEKILKEFAEENGFIGYLYTSPKNDINIEQAAKFLVKEIIRRQKSLEQSSINRRDTIIMANHSNRLQAQQNNKSSCCH